jgi:chromate transport protein ChrA
MVFKGMSMRGCGGLMIAYLCGVMGMVRTIFINIKCILVQGEVMTIQKETFFLEAIGIIILFFSVNTFTRDYVENKELAISSLLYSIILVFLISMGLLLLYKYVVEKK